MIKIDFEFDTQHGKYRDALHLPDDHGLTESEIEAMKQARRDNWIDAVENLPLVPDPEPVSQPPETIEIAGETYSKLTGIPLSGAKLIEANGVWYYLV